KDAEELFEVRAALEALSARLAAEKATDDDLRSLEEIVERGEKAALANQFEVLPDLNTAFHLRMMEMADNAQLARLLGDLRDRIQWLYSHRIEQRALASWKEHRELYDALRARLPEVAAHIALHHVSAARAAFVQTQSADR